MNCQKRNEIGANRRKTWGIKNGDQPSEEKLICWGHSRVQLWRGGRVLETRLFLALQPRDSNCPHRRLHSDIHSSFYSLPKLEKSGKNSLVGYDKSSTKTMESCLENEDKRARWNTGLSLGRTLSQEEQYSMSTKGLHETLRKQLMGSKALRFLNIWLLPDSCSQARFLWGTCLMSAIVKMTWIWDEVVHLGMFICCSVQGTNHYLWWYNFNLHKSVGRRMGRARSGRKIPQIKYIDR